MRSISGFEPSTLTQYAREFPTHKARAQAQAAAYQANRAEDIPVDNGIGIQVDEVRNVIDRHAVPPWHLYIYKDRHTRWDVLEICKWAAVHIPKDASILSVGCGMAFNLYWFARNGYKDLHGFDRDAKAIAASQELLTRHGLPIELWVDDARNENHSFVDRFDYIEAMNCLMYEDRLYPRFLKAYAKALKPSGYLALDVIDASYNKTANNQYMSRDWHRPVLERAFSEYKVRVSERDIIDMAAQQGLAVAMSITERNPGDPARYLRLSESSDPKKNCPPIDKFIDGEEKNPGTSLGIFLKRAPAARADLR